ncbi:hypothetical protein ASD56_03725 [Microbacterium sp. Root166]|uniref:hypothetical protein n=1 Tax=Microbacterium sp. Root166 TaxID=1736478 RepID=UPI00070133C6|nr:hypothetical protein [Microbacterium sp. Root166]KQZ85453.1 hypothetical protein ASD56_03725 [Microbacterium sp. Root166]
MNGRPRRIAATTVMVIAALLAGCAPATEPPVPSGAVLATGGYPDGVSAELQQLRSDVAGRVAQVLVRNDSDETLVVSGLEVSDPRFDGAATRTSERETVIAPGRQVGIRVQLPPVACDEIDADATVRPSVVFGYTLGGVAGAASAPLPDPLDVIAPLHERECRVVLLSQAADVAFTEFTPSTAGEPAQLTLTLTPTGAGGAGIHSIQTTNLLTFAGVAGDDYPLGIEFAEGESAPIVVELPLVPFRCDAHAVQEDKRGTIFDLAVQIDGEDGEIELAAPEELRGRILTWVADWCGFGS